MNNEINIIVSDVKMTDIFKDVRKIKRRPKVSLHKDENWTVTQGKIVTGVDKFEICFQECEKYIKFIINAKGKKVFSFRYNVATKTVTGQEINLRANIDILARMNLKSLAGDTISSYSIIKDFLKRNPDLQEDSKLILMKSHICV